MISEDMWQEFYIESSENLDSLEQLLLTLEQHPEDITVLNECFRNMHNIKGAARYMGLQGITQLTHSMENIFDKLRKKEMQFSTDVINISFEVIDFLRKLLKNIDKDKSTPDDTSAIVSKINDFINAGGKLAETPQKVIETQEIPVETTITPEIPADKPQPQLQLIDEDDQELIAIFTDEVHNLFNSLAKLNAKETITPNEVLLIIKDLHRVTNFVGYDDILKEIIKIEEEIQSKFTDEINKEDFSALLIKLKDIFEPKIGTIYLDISYTKTDEICREDDPELFAIYLEHVKEKCLPLKEVPEIPTEEWSKKCEEAIYSIKHASYYMDYTDMHTLMEEATERLTESLTKHGKGEKFNPEPLRNIWIRMTNILPELLKEEEKVKTTEVIDISEKQKEVTPDTIAIQDVISTEDILRFEEEILTPPSHEIIVESQPVVEGTIPEGLTKDFEESLEDFFGGFISTKEVPKEPKEAPKPPEPTTTPEIVQPKPKEVESAFRGEELIKKLTPKETTTHKTTSIAQTVRVDLERVEKILGDVSELVVLKSSISHILEDIKSVYKYLIEDLKIDTNKLKKFKGVINKLTEQNTTFSRIVSQIQDEIMRMRMLPVSHLFERFPRMVRDLSQSLGKKVNLVTIGTETELDKRVIEQMVDPLMHIIRNAIDHGIEPPDVRKRLGKPEAGQITLAASQEGGHVIIRVIDDGRGLDREKIIAKAISNNLIRPEDAAKLSNEQVWEFIFASGFSTAHAVSEVSGRGVGLDVVQKNVEKINGEIKVNSIQGEGTEFIIKIPLTLAIIPSMLVKVGKQVMAIPLDVIVETTRIFADEIGTAEGFELIPYRQRTLPIIRLSNIFKGTDAEANPKKLFIVVVKLGNTEAGLAVDALIGQQDIVVKPLSEFLTDQPGFAGATIMGDGSIGLILDIPAIFHKAKLFVLKRQQMMEELLLKQLSTQNLTMH